MMEHQPLLARRKRLLGRALVTLFVLSVFGLAQIANAQSTEKPTPTDPLSGKFEGMVKGSPGVDTRLTLEISNDKGKLTGRLLTEQGPTPILEGTFTDGKIVLKLGHAGTATTLTATLQGDKLTGDWTEGRQKRTIELKKVPTVASETPATVPPSPGPVSLTGDWDGLADAQDGFPFALTLKLEGEKVTGESSSALGTGAISNGSFKDGKLVFQIDSPNGTILMSAVLKDGGLVGDFDYVGQAQGRWVAKKKTP
jgi:hypothetical protein